MAQDLTNQAFRRNGRIDERIREANRVKSKVRARVEHVFGTIKRVFGFRKVRFRGLFKNRHHARMLWHLPTCSPRDDDCWQRREDPRGIEKRRSGMKSGRKRSTDGLPDGPLDRNLSVTVDSCAPSISKTPVNQTFPKERGWIIVSDTTWEGYEETPAVVMQGYGVMMREIASQLPGTRAPSHVFVQAGVGGLAAAVHASASK